MNKQAVRRTTSSKEHRQIKNNNMEQGRARGVAMLSKEQQKEEQCQARSSKRSNSVEFVEQGATRGIITSNKDKQKEKECQARSLNIEQGLITTNQSN